MKCKQCGWKNPDNIDRCEKCNHVLTKPRMDEMQPTGYDAERPVADRTSPGYAGGYPGAENQQPYNAQPYNGNPYNAQPYAGQPYNAQPYNAQPYNAQPYSGLPNNGRQYGGQPYTGQPYSGRLHYSDSNQFIPEGRPSQPQHPFNPAYGQEQYAKPQQNQYETMQQPHQYAPQAAARAEERYCPECDAELPDGATECPVCHTKIEVETIVVVEGVCPDCGTEVTPVQRFCHNCGAPLNVRESNNVAAVPEPEQLSRQPEQPYSHPEADVLETNKDESEGVETEAAVAYNEADIDDTVAAGPLSEQVPECELRMIDASGETVRRVSCAGDEVELYRDNTDPANNTIARDLQAKLTFADGKWSIEDCSALQTTFIRPCRKMELQDGDIVVMGNRQFIFKS